MPSLTAYTVRLFTMEQCPVCTSTKDPSPPSIAPNMPVPPESAPTAQLYPPTTDEALDLAAFFSTPWLPKSIVPSQYFHVPPVIDACVPLAMLLMPPVTDANSPYFAVFAFSAGNRRPECSLCSVPASHPKQSQDWQLLRSQRLRLKRMHRGQKLELYNPNTTPVHRTYKYCRHLPRSGYGCRFECIAVRIKSFGGNARKNSL